MTDLEKHVNRPGRDKLVKKVKEIKENKIKPIEKNVNDINL